MNSRRRFMASALMVGASVAIGGVACAVTNTAKRSATADACFFDIAAAQEVLSGNSQLIHGPLINYSWLNLGGFTAHDEIALNFLAERMKPVEGIVVGFTDLTPESAIALAKLSEHFFCLTCLTRLDEPLAVVLGGQSFRTGWIRCFVIQEPLTAKAAFAVVGGGIPLSDDECDSPLDLALPSVSGPVARALCCHPHELYLQVSDEALSPEAAEALAHHAGYSLSLTVRQELSRDAMAALKSNPAKRVDSRLFEGGVAYQVTEDSRSAGVGCCR